MAKKKINNDDLSVVDILQGKGKYATQRDFSAGRVYVPGGKLDKYTQDMRSSQIRYIDDLRGEAQGWGEKVFHGTTKAGGKLALRTAHGILSFGYLMGLGKLEDPSKGYFQSLWDNDLNRTIDDLTKQLDEALPNYYTQEAMDNPLALQHLVSANFVFDKLLDGLSFVGAAYLTGSVGAGALSNLGKLAQTLRGASTLSKSANTAKNVTKVAKNLERMANLKDKSNLAQKIGLSAYASMTEASIEAYHAYDEALETMINNRTAEKRSKGDYSPISEEELEDFKHRSSSVGNFNFLANMFITGGTTYYQLGDHFARKGFVKNITSNSKRLIKDPKTGKTIVDELPKRKQLWNKWFPLVKVSLMEGVEESSQNFSSSFLVDYFTEDEKSRDAFKSFRHATHEALGTEEGWEEFILGAIIGLGMGVKNGKHRESAKQEKKLQENAAIINKMPEVQKAYLKSAMGSIGRQMHNNVIAEDALQRGDKFSYLGMNALKLHEMVSQYIETDTFEDYIDTLEKHKELTNDEFAEYLELDNVEHKDAMIDEMIDKSKKLKKSYDRIKAGYGHQLDNTQIGFLATIASITNDAANRQVEIMNTLKEEYDFDLMNQIFDRSKGLDSTIQFETIQDLNKQLNIKQKEAETVAEKRSKNKTNQRLNDNLRNINQEITKLAQEIEKLSSLSETEITDENYMNIIDQMAVETRNNLNEKLRRRTADGIIDPSRRKEFNDLYYDFLRLNKVKDNFVELYNNLTNEDTYKNEFKKLQDKIEKVRHNKLIDRYFTVKGVVKEQVESEEGVFNSEDVESDIVLEKGLYQGNLKQESYIKDGKTTMVDTKFNFYEIKDRRVSNEEQLEDGEVKTDRLGYPRAEVLVAINGGKAEWMDVNKLKYKKLQKYDYVEDGIKYNNHLSPEHVFYNKHKDRLITITYEEGFTYDEAQAIIKRNKSIYEAGKKANKKVNLSNGGVREYKGKKDGKSQFDTKMVSKSGFLGLNKDGEVVFRVFNDTTKRYEQLSTYYVSRQTDDGQQWAVPFEFKVDQSRSTPKGYYNPEVRYTDIRSEELSRRYKLAKFVDREIDQLNKQIEELVTQDKDSTKSILHKENEIEALREDLRNLRKQLIESEEGASEESINRDHERELDENANKIVEAVDDYKVTDNDGNINYVQIRTYKDGSKKLYEGKTLSRNDNPVKPKTTTVEDDFDINTHFSDDAIESIGQRTAEQAKLDELANKINKKYQEKLEDFRNNPDAFQVNTEIGIIKSLSHLIKKIERKIAKLEEQLEYKRTSLEILQEEAKFLKDNSLKELAERLHESNYTRDQHNIIQPTDSLFTLLNIEGLPYDYNVSEVLSKIMETNEQLVEELETFKDTKQELEGEIIDRIKEFAMPAVVSYLDAMNITNMTDADMDSFIASEYDSILEYAEENNLLEDVENLDQQVEAVREKGVRKEDLISKLESLEEQLNDIATSHIEQAEQRLPFENGEQLRLYDSEGKLRNPTTKELHALKQYLENNDTVENRDAYNRQLELATLRSLRNSYEYLEQYAHYDERLAYPDKKDFWNAYNYNHTHNKTPNIETPAGKIGDNVVDSAIPLITHNGERPFMKTTGPANLFKDGVPVDATNEQKSKFIFNNAVTLMDVEQYAVQIVDATGLTEIDSSVVSKAPEAAGALYAVITDLEGNLVKFDITGKALPANSKVRGLVAHATLPDATWKTQKDTGYDRFRTEKDADGNDRIPTFEENGVLIAVNEAHQEFLTNFVAERKTISDTLAKGEKVFYKINDKSLGMRIPGDDIKLSRAVKHKLNESNADEMIIVANTKVLEVSGQDFPTVAGKAYYINYKTKQVIPLNSRLLTDTEVNSMINAIIAYNEESTTLTHNDLQNNILGVYVNWGKPAENSDISYEVRFNDNNNNKSIIFNEVREVSNGRFVNIKNEVNISDLSNSNNANTKKFREFLSRRTHQVDRGKLEALATAKKEGRKKLPKTGVVIYDSPTETRFLSDSTYYDYLISNDYSPLTVNMVPNVNSTDGIIKPQWTGAYLRLGNRVEPAKPTAKKVAKTKKGKAPEAGNEAGNEVATTNTVDLGHGFKIVATVGETSVEVYHNDKSIRISKDGINALSIPSNEVLNALKEYIENDNSIEDSVYNDLVNAIKNPKKASSSEKTSKRSLKKSLRKNNKEDNTNENSLLNIGLTEIDASQRQSNREKADSRIKRHARKGVNKLKEISDKNRPAGHNLLKHKAIENEPKMTTKAYNEAVKRLTLRYGARVERVKGLIDGKGYGRYVEAVDNIDKVLLSDQAVIGTDFHEEFHIVEQGYLTDKEQTILYNKYRELDKIEHERLRKKDNTLGEYKELTDEQVSEGLAEAYRYYALHRESQSKYKGSVVGRFLKAIHDFMEFLKNFFVGSHILKDPDIKQLFSEIYDGEFSQQAFTTSKFTVDEKIQLFNTFNHQLYTNIDKPIDDGGFGSNLFLYIASKEERDSINNYILEEYGEEYGETEDLQYVLFAKLIDDVFTDDLIDQMGVDLYNKIVDNVELLKDEYFEHLDRNFNYEFEQIVENSEETNEQRDPFHLMNSAEHDHAGKPSRIVRTILSTLEGSVNSLGLIESVNLDEMVKTLHTDLQGVETWEEISNLLNAKSESTGIRSYYPAILQKLNEVNDIIIQQNSIVKDLLGYPDLTKSEQVAIVSLKNTFLTNFAKMKLDYNSVNVEYDSKSGDYSVKVINQTKEANRKRIRSTFNNNVNLQFERREGLFEHWKGDGVFKQANNFKSQLKKEVDSKTIQSTYDIFQILKRLGIEFSDSEFYDSTTADEALKRYNITPERFRNRMVTDKDFALLKLMGDKVKPGAYNIFGNNLNLGSEGVSILIDLETAIVGENLNNTVLTNDLKKLYPFSDENTLSKKIKDWNKVNPDRSPAKVVSIVESSKIIRHGNEGREKVETGAIDELSAVELLISDIAISSTGIFPFLFSGSKSMYYGVQGMTSYEHHNGSRNVAANHIEIIQKEFDFYNRQITELETDTNVLSVDYKDFKGTNLNLVQDLINNNELFNLIKDKFQTDQNFDLDSYLSKNLDIKYKLLGSIRDRLSERAKQLVEVFKNNDLFDVSKEGLTKIKGIPNSLLNYYPTDAVDSKNKRLYKTEKAAHDVLENILMDYIANSEYNRYVQLEAITGNISYYKDPLKRFMGYQGTRLNVNVGQEFLDLYNNHIKHENTTLKRPIFNEDGTIEYEEFKFSNTIPMMTVNDVTSNNEAIGEYFRNLNDMISAAAYDSGDPSNGAVNVTDAQGYEHIDFYRFRRIAEGTWSENLEAIYEKEVTGESLTAEDVYLMIGKTQGVSQYDHNGQTTPVFIKTSVIIPSLVKDSELKRMSDWMGNNGIGILMNESAIKFGKLVDSETNRGLDAFDKNGRFTGFEGNDPEFVSQFFQEVDLRFYGTQVKMNDLPGTRVATGTQQRTHILANILKDLGPEYNQWSKIVIAELHNLETSRSEQNLDKLKKRLGLKPVYETKKKSLTTRHSKKINIYAGSMDVREDLSEERGIIITDNIIGYEFESYETLADELTKETEMRDLPISIKNDINYMLEKYGKLDLIPRESKIESILSSIINADVIKAKRNGDSKPMVSSAGFQSFNVTKDTADKYNLKFYEMEEGSNNFVMEIFLPSYLQDRVNLGSEIDINGDAETNPLLQIIGFRIPTQGLNSIEAIRVKGFLPASMGNAVVVPKEITAKAGSDFDIDKLNLYFPNSKSKYKNGKIVSEYIEYKTDNNSTVRDRYNDHVNDNVKDLKGILKDLKSSEEYQEHLAKIEEHYNEYRNEVNDIIESIQELEDSVENTNNQEWRALSEDIKEIYKALERRFTNSEIKGLDKIEAYSQYTDALIEVYSNDSEIVENLIALKAVYDYQLTVAGRVLDAKNSINAAKLGYKSFASSEHEAMRNRMIDFIAEYEGLQSISEFEALPIEKQNTTEAIENRFIELNLEILKHPANRQEMLTPNTDYHIKGIAKGHENSDVYSVDQSVRALKNRNNPLRKIDVLDPYYMIEQKKAFEAGKNTLAQFSLHSVNHVKAQQAGLLMDYKVFSRYAPRFDNFTNSNGRLDLIYDEVGRLITKNIEEFQNAAVDAEKDEYLSDLNITTDTVPVIMYLIRLGVPLEEASYFLAQPAITAFIDNIHRLTADPKKTRSKGEVMKDARQAVKKLITTDSNYIGDFNIENLKQGIIDSSDGNIDNAFQKMVLEEFFKYLDMGRELNTLIQVTTFDTKGTATSFAGNEIKARQYDKYINDPEYGAVKVPVIKAGQKKPVMTHVKTFTPESVNRFFEYEQDGQNVTTYTGYFKDVVIEANKYYGSLFEMNKHLDNVVMKTLVDNIINSYVSDEVKVRNLNNLKRELLTFIAQNNITREGNSLNTRKSMITRGEDSIPNQIDAIKKGDSKLSDNYLIQNLIPIMHPDTAHVLYLEDANDVSVERANNFTEAFYELYSVNPELAYGIVEQSILQSGFVNSPTTIHNIIPVEILADVVGDFYSDEVISYSEFKDIYLYKNRRNINIVPATRTNEYGFEEIPFGREFAYDRSEDNLLIRKGRIKSIKIKANEIYENLKDYGTYSLVKENVDKPIETVYDIGEQISKVKEMLNMVKVEC